MYIAEELKILVNKENIDGIVEDYIANLYQIVSKYFADKSMFSIDNFSAIVYDEYILQTNCHSDIFSNIYLEINQPLNYKLSTKPKKKKSDKIQIPDLYITLSDIKNGLYQTFLQHFNSSNIVWQDRYGICLKTIIPNSNDQKIEYYFRLVPCFTYYNKNNVKGVMYYSNGDIEIDYPELAINNFYKKNEETNDLFRQIILMFKNILLKNPDIDRLPSEIIETILYNVPNELFVSDNKSDVLNIVNFIRNNPLKEFRTMDEEDLAFASLYKSMSLYYCKHIMKIIEKYLTSK